MQCFPEGCVKHLLYNQTVSRLFPSKVPNRDHCPWGISEDCGDLWFVEMKARITQAAFKSSYSALTCTVQFLTVSEESNTEELFSVSPGPPPPTPNTHTHTRPPRAFTGYCFDPVCLIVFLGQAAITSYNRPSCPRKEAAVNTAWWHGNTLEQYAP